MYSIESATDFRRRRAVELILKGEPKVAVARIFGVHLSSLRVWMQKFKAGESLKTKPGAGRPRRLTDAQLEQLRELLVKGATWLLESV